MKDITVVTGFYDIGRGKWGTHPQHGNFARSVDTYFGYFSTLAELKNPMVIVTSPDLADRVYDIRRKFGLESLTKVIAKQLSAEQRRRVHDNVGNNIFRNYVMDNSIPEFSQPDYSLVTNQKSQFVVDAIDSGFVQTSQVAWIDFGYCRAPGWFNAAKPWEYDFGDKINMWALRPIDNRPIFDVVRTAMIYFMGCHIVGPTMQWHSFNDSWQASFNSLLECGFADDDQTTMLMVYRKNPEKFQLRHGVDRGKNSWYFILSQFNDNHQAMVEPTIAPGLVLDVGVLG